MGSAEQSKMKTKQYVLEKYDSQYLFRVEYIDNDFVPKISLFWKWTDKKTWRQKRVSENMTDVKYLRWQWRNLIAQGFNRVEETATRMPPT